MKLKNLPDIRLNDVYVEPRDRPMLNYESDIFFMDDNEDKKWSKRIFIYDNVIIEKELDLNRRLEDVNADLKKKVQELRFYNTSMEWYYSRNE
jgi:hypothetical protein